MGDNDITIYTVAEVAKILKVNKNKVYQLIKLGYIKKLNYGSTKIPKFAIEDFLRQYTGYDFSTLSHKIA